MQIVFATHRLGEEYQAISDKALTEPKNTAELMALIEYVKHIETVVIFEMEDRLREVMNYILFLSDYIILTPIEIRQNSQTFLWYSRMAQVFEDNRQIVKLKTVEYQKNLKVKF